jgi:DNA replication protein DnaC
MAYSREVFEAAAARLEERRRRTLEENERVRRRLYTEIPRLAGIETELADTGIRVAKEILAEGGAEGARRIGQLKKENLELQAERAELLTLGGYPADALEVRHVCQKCKDTGYDGDRICSCLKKLLREEASVRANSGSPLPLYRFDDLRLDYYPETPIDGTSLSVRRHMESVLRYCRKYAESFSEGSKSLIFLGKTGLGKTHLALSIANEVIAQGHSVVYDTSQNIFMKMEEEYFGRAEQDGKKYTHSINECDLLVIDDLGAEFSTSFNVSALYNIINTRTLAGRPVIVSANITESELLARYSERIFSRLIGDFILLKFFGSDIRQIKLRGGSV